MHFQHLLFGYCELNLIPFELREANAKRVKAKTHSIFSCLKNLRRAQSGGNVCEHARAAQHLWDAAINLRATAGKAVPSNILNPAAGDNSRGCFTLKDKQDNV